MASVKFFNGPTPSIYVIENPRSKRSLETSGSSDLDAPGNENGSEETTSQKRRSLLRRRKFREEEIAAIQLRLTLIAVILVVNVINVSLLAHVAPKLRPRLREALGKRFTQVTAETDESAGGGSLMEMSTSHSTVSRMIKG